MTAPAAEGAKGPRLRTWQDFASAEVGFRACGHDQRTEPVWRLCDRPLETFARSLFKLYGDPALAGRGGSASCRDHNPKTRNRAHLAWAHKSAGAHKPIPSHSSGEGVWGRGASLREAASPPALPRPPTSFSSADRRRRRCRRPFRGGGSRRCGALRGCEGSAARWPR